ncbi:MAG: hypothetical protein ABR613_09080 [Actinomycetota bacterium]
MHLFGLGRFASLGRNTSILSLVVGLIFVSFVPVSPGWAGSEKKREDRDCRFEAEDRNRDGDFDEGETQECGGESFGEGGADPGAAEAVSDGSHQLTDQGLALHWTHPSGNERKIILRDSTTGSWADKLPNVQSDWGQSSEFRFVRQQAETDATHRLNCPMPEYYGRVKVCNHSDYNFSGNTIGRFKIKYNAQGHIQKGRVKLKNSATESERRPLMCQEIGHTLGLAHRETTASCMKQEANLAANSPDGHDYEQLVDQTHAHGGESETGGINSDLDVGGGILDGCTDFVCYEFESDGQGGFWLTGNILDRSIPSSYLYRLL